MPPPLHRSAAALFRLFRFTDIGTAIRACADSYTGALTVGLDVNDFTRTFGWGQMRGSGGAVLVLSSTSPQVGLVYTLLAFVVVSSPAAWFNTGALLGGVLIGSALAGLISPVGKSMFAFAILVLVLLFVRRHSCRMSRDRAAHCGCLTPRLVLRRCWRHGTRTVRRRDYFSPF
jgi:branched-subunit amino acid ABC-type transport system permease component